MRLMTPAVVLVFVCSACGSGEPRPPEPQPLSDSAAVGVLLALNGAEARAAESVVARLAGPEARTYAQDMRSAHRALEDRLRQLDVEQDLEGGPSGLSEAIDDDAAQTIVELRPLPDAALDFAYVATQVRMHRDTLVLLDCAMAAAPGNFAFDSFRRFTLRPDIRAHFVRAVELYEQYRQNAAGPELDTRTTAACHEACEADSARALPAPVRAASCR